MSSCWNIYAVTKQNNNDTSGKPTVARHNFRNDSARYIELLLLPTLFSSILAVLSNILAFVRKETTCNSEPSPVRQLCSVDTWCSPAFNLFHPWRYFTSIIILWKEIINCFIPQLIRFHFINEILCTIKELVSEKSDNLYSKMRDLIAKETICSRGKTKTEEHCGTY